MLRSKYTIIRDTPSTYLIRAVLAAETIFELSAGAFLRLRSEIQHGKYEAVLHFRT